MDKYTKDTKKWLDDVAWRRAKNGIYVPHQPIYGFNDPECGISARAVWCYTIVYNILRCLQGKKKKINTVVDIGCGEGYLANQIKAFTGARTFIADISHTAIKRAGQIYGIYGVVADMHNMPFKNKSFDLVICTEAIEHLIDPAAAIRELERISNKMLLITTPFAHSQREKEVFFKNQDPAEPHRHLHFFTKREIRDLLGTGAVIWGCNSSLLNWPRLFLGVNVYIKEDATKRHNLAIVFMGRLIIKFAGELRRLLGNVQYVKMQILMDRVASRFFQKTTKILLATKEYPDRKYKPGSFYRKDIFRHILLDCSVKWLKIEDMPEALDSGKTEVENVKDTHICAL